MLPRPRAAAGSAWARALGFGGGPIGTAGTEAGSSRSSRVPCTRSDDRGAARAPGPRQSLGRGRRHGQARPREPRADDRDRNKPIIGAGHPSRTSDARRSSPAVAAQSTGPVRLADAPTWKPSGTGRSSFPLGAEPAPEVNTETVQRLLNGSSLPLSRTVVAAKTLGLRAGAREPSGGRRRVEPGDRAAEKS